jgi:hypothetical protein
VQEETTQELRWVEGHDALFAAVRIIPPAETHLLSVEGQEAMVRNGHAVGVAPEVARTWAGPPKGGLA